MLVIPCASRIAQVCVYARGAAVRRRLELPAKTPAEACELVVGGITAQAEPGSLRVEVAGERAVVGLSTRLSAPAGAAPPADVGARRRALAVEQHKLNAEAEHLRRRRQALVDLRPDLRLGKEALTRTRDGLACASLVGDLQGELDARLRELELELERLGREGEALEAEARSEAAGGEPGLSREVTIRLAPGAGPLEGLVLEYVVRAARWWPAYEARLERGGQRASFGLDAIVAQTSGEPWREVQLSLSTADLVTDARLPELPSLRLGRAQPPRPRGYRSPPEGLDGLFMGYEAALRSAGPPPAPPPVLAPSSTLTGGPPGPPRDARDFDSNEDGFAREEEGGHFQVGAMLIAPDVLGSGDPFGGGGGDPFSAGGATGGLHGDPFAPANPFGAPFGAPPGGPPLAKPAPPPAQSRSRAGGGEMSKRRAGRAEPAPESPAPEPPAPEPAALEPADAWLDFDALALAGRHGAAAERGRLVRRGAPQEQQRAAGRGLEALGLAQPPTYTRDPREERGRFDHTYTASGLADVGSTPAITRVSLQHTSAEVRQELWVVPAVEDQVYRHALLTNPLEAPLLGGPVDVYLEGSLLTTSPLTRVGRGGAIELGLGVEERVRVARNVRIEESTSGLMSKTTTVKHEVRIELRSSLGAPARAVVIDRLPVVAEGEDALEVALVETTPRAERYTQAEREGGARVAGGLRWDLELPPGGRVEVVFTYRIDLPAKREVVGGNRRD